MKTFLHIGLAFIFLIPTFQSCKKGENDPVISLQTRKARLANNWAVTFSEITNGDTVKTFNGEVEVVKIGEIELANIPSTQNYLFEKDGGYTIEISRTYPAGYLDSAVGVQVVNTLETGTWSFAGGNGEVKTKEQLLLLPNRWERRIEGFAEVEVKTWEGQNIGMIYNLDMLKSSEMRWVFDRTSNTPLGVERSSGTIEFQEI